MKVDKRGRGDDPPQHEPNRTRLPLHTMPFWGSAEVSADQGRTGAGRREDDILVEKAMVEAEMRGFVMAAEGCGKVRERVT